MAENFGKQFITARETLGLSTKEVAAKIKIRQEYIEDIENNKFDFPLPNVYIRGFIRNYAKLLKLDIDGIMRDCPIHEFRVLDSIKCHANSIVEVVRHDNCDGPNENSTEKKDIEKNTQIFSNFINFLREKAIRLPKRNVFIYSGTALLSLLLIIAVVIFKNKKDDFDVSGIIPVDVQNVSARSIVLSTTSAVNIVVRNKGTLEKIYAGNLPAGTIKTIAYYKPIHVFYDRGEYLLIQQDDGEKIYPQPGRGGVEIK